jgi:hypothetical protein
VSLKQRNSSQANVCSEQEFETLLRRSEEHLKSKRSSAAKPESLQSNSLKIVPPLRRRDSAA